MSTGAGFPDRTEVPSVVAGPENAVAKALLVDDRKDNLIALEAILQGLPVEPGAKGVVFNADPTAIVRFLDIGTRVTPSRR